MTANGILIGDGKEESDVILVGKVLSFVENKTSLETNYLVEVEKYLKTPKNYDTNTKTVSVISPGLRQYDEPQQMMIYDKIFNIDDRVLFLLYQKDGKLKESLYSLTTKSNCSPKQLLDEMYGETGLHISQNNQNRHFYTNQPIDLTYYGYNRDLMAEKKDFEFKVNVPKTGQILSEKTQLDFQNCKRTASASWSFTPTIAGRYAFHSIIGNNEGGSEAFSGFLIEDYVDSPLKQFKSGISVDKIQCRDNLQLILKTSNNSPTCVKPETKTKLLERGWGEHTPIPEPEIIKETDFDSEKYYEEFDSGSPLIYLDTSNPVLDNDNCERYAYWLTKYQKEKLDKYEDYPRYPPWGNQIFPLVDYCITNGNLIKTIVNDKIQWSFSGISENKTKLDTKKSNSGISSIKETILSNASYNEIQEKIQHEVDKNNLAQFSSLVIKNLKKEYQDGEKITFDLYAFGYRDWCIFPQISLYFDGYDEPIYEKSISHSCPAPTGNPSPRASHYEEYDFGQFPSCKFVGTYTIKGESYEFDSETLGSFYCNGKKEFHEPKIFDIEIPENTISEKINFEPNEIHLSWGDYIRVTNHESVAILVLGESKQTEKTGEVQFGFLIKPGESWKEKILYEGNHWITARYENDTVINGMNGTIHFEE